MILLGRENGEEKISAVGLKLVMSVHSSGTMTRPTVQMTRMTWLTPLTTLSLAVVFWW